MHDDVDEEAEYVPAKHAEQTLAPAAEYWPAAHTPVTADRPVVPQYEPAVQLVHED